MTNNIQKIGFFEIFWESNVFLIHVKAFILYDDIHLHKDLIVSLSLFITLFNTQLFSHNALFT